MLINDNRKEFYDIIQKSRQHTLIIVNHDIDSLTSLKLIQYLFECDNIPYTIIPIRTITELKQSYQERLTLLLNNIIKFILLINIGSLYDINELLLPENDDLKIFIADYHRPINIYNIYNQKNIYHLCTITNLNNIDDELRMIPKYQNIFWDEQDDIDLNNDINDLTIEQLNKRNRFKLFEQKRQNLLQQYNEFNYYTYSTTLIFFDLLWHLGRDSFETLLLVIISVQDKQNLYRLSNNKYKNELNYLLDSMKRLKNIQQNDNFIFVNNNSNNDQQQELMITTNKLQITYEKDLNLRLYREWSLYDSINHSIYTICGFKLFKLMGKKRLHRFFAELGLPIRQCQQKYQSMDLDLRRKLLQEIDEKKSKYNLNKLIFFNFLIKRGNDNNNNSNGGGKKYSSIDLSLAIRSLLESSDNNKNFNEKFFDSFNSLSWTSISMTNTNSNNQYKQQQNELINIGITLSKLQLSAIIKQIQLIIDAHLIQLMNNVLWYVIIPESQPDLNLFCHPGCLKLLTIYTLSAYASYNSKSQRCLQLPLLIITPDPYRKNLSLICGCSPLLAIKECRTFYRQAFLQTSKRMIENVNVKNWYFEESIIDPDIAYITYKDSYNFLHELSLLLESSSTTTTTKT